MKNSTGIISIYVLLFLNSLYSQDQFTEQTSISITGVYASSVKWGDYDNDSDLDLLLTGYTGTNWVSKIYKNNNDNTFTEQTGISLTGVYTSSVDWGDYDNDGDLDIVLTGGYYSGSHQRISKIYRNNGDNTFAEQTSISLPSVDNSSVAWGDYDNDGDLDILLTGQIDNSGDAISKVFRNNGDNTFTDQTSISLVAVYAGSVAWGDYDNDSDLDILLTGRNGSTNISKIYRNNGDNTFTDQSSISLAGVWLSSVTWGDYDNDGDLDVLLTGDTGSGYVSKIYKNNSNNTFTDQTLISLTGVCFSSVAWGDYDNDGDLDILLTGMNSPSPTYSQISKIYKNNGDNTFAEQTSIVLPGVRANSVAWGDYDNDKDLDFILTGYDGIYYITKIYLNNNLAANTTPTIPTNLLTSVDGSDVNFSWDKSTDIETPQNGLKYNLVIGTTPNGIKTLSPMSDRSTGYRRIISLGNTNNNSSWTIKGLPDGEYYWSVQAIDNAFSGSNFAEEKSFLKPEQFTEQTSISLTGVYQSSVAWGDYDNDGDLDILLTGDTGNGYVSKIYRNNGDNTFSDQSSMSLVDVYSGAVAWGDYDNDSDLDILLTGNSLSGDISKVYRNDVGEFSDIEAGLTGVQISAVAWGDYDNDGDLDILLTGASGDYFSKIYRNDGGSFTDINSGLDLAPAGSAAWGDYDNDGDLDILITGNWTSKVYRNDNGTFISSSTLMGLAWTSSVWGDYDNDGDLDILHTGFNLEWWNPQTQLYRNDGGIFNYISFNLIDVGYSSVAWGDYDNDGDLDILLSGENAVAEPITIIYRNNGDNTFTEQTSISLTGVQRGCVAWGDYDNDGDLDILLTGSGVAKIYRNNNITTNTIPNSPTNLAASIDGIDVTFSWDKSTDTETPQNGLRYNLVIGTNPNAVNTLSPMSDRTTGYRRVINLGNTNHNNSWTIKGLKLDDYYWSVQSIDNTFVGSPFSSEQTLTVSHFTKVWENPYQPMNIYITSATIDGVDLGAGDEIAIFDGDICVGLGLLKASIPPEGYLSIIASTDDPTTTEIDGFIPGHTLTYKFWDSNRSSEIYRITANYSAGSGTFSSLGTAVLGLVGIYTITHDIGLTSGWNIFSLRAVPSNPDMLQLLNSLITSQVLIKVQDESGNAVEQLPSPIGWINSIGNWSATEGYYIKVNATSNLSITDPPIQLPISIPLKNGWNIISYPALTEQNALVALQPLITANQLIKVQDELGNAVEYLLGIGWINNIGNFKSGEGYYLKVNAITSLTLSESALKPLENGNPKVKQNLIKVTTNHFQPVYTSPYLPMNIYITGAVLTGGGSLGADDEIGIFDGSLCVGAHVLTEPISPVISTIASMDDPTTTATIDGFISGHNISYKFWLSSSSTEISDYTMNYSTGNGTFSPQGTAVLSFTDILPVELISFIAHVNKNQVNLKWETATEVNNFGFEIERKSSGDWLKMGFIRGSGNCNSPKNYEFIDKNPTGGSRFMYRLRQIDSDGTYEYSDIVEVEILPTEFELSQNYPNPFNPSTKIKFSVPNQSELRIELYNMVGEKVRTLADGKYETGNYEIDLDMGNLPSGIYLYKMQSNGFVKVRKLLLMK